MANIQRLSKEGRLALVGPCMGDASGWRGLFVLAVEDFDAARALVAAEPLIAKGEMIAEYQHWYGSAATMLVGELHEKLAKKSP